VLVQRYRTPSRRGTADFAAPDSPGKSVIRVEVEASGLDRPQAMEAMAAYLLAAVARSSSRPAPSIRSEVTR
jgi:hypothetical protein